MSSRSRRPSTDGNSAEAAAGDLAQALRCLDAAVGRRVLVIGDFMLDHYLIGDVSRISPEAPVPVVAVTKEYSLPGGAGNVARNLSALGLIPVCCGVVGDDANGQFLKEHLVAAGAEVDGLCVQPGARTTSKTRVLARSQHVLRVDREDKWPLSAPACDQLMECAGRAIGTCDALLFSDYAKGVLTEALVATATRLAVQDRRPVIADPKPTNARLFVGATLICPNASEAAQATGVACDTDQGVESAAAALLSDLGVRAVLVTRGDRGMYLVSSDGAASHLTALATEVYDVTGAGDTVTATAAAALVGGSTALEAALLANVAASHVVRHLGCAAVDRAELEHGGSWAPTGAHDAG